jgi:hypothetical protein
MIRPGVVAAIFEDAQLRLVRTADRVVRDDDRDVTFAGDHRVGPVRLALERTAGMGVHVADDGEGTRPAGGPQLREGRCVQDAYARPVGVRI